MCITISTTQLVLASCLLKESLIPQQLVLLMQGQVPHLLSFLQLISGICPFIKPAPDMLTLVTLY